MIDDTRIKARAVIKILLVPFDGLSRDVMMTTFYNDCIKMVKIQVQPSDQKSHFCHLKAD